MEGGVEIHDAPERKPGEASWEMLDDETAPTRIDEAVASVEAARARVDWEPIEPAAERSPPACLPLRAPGQRRYSDGIPGPSRPTATASTASTR